MSHLTRADDKHQRRILFRRDSHCHWCGVLTVDPGATLDFKRDDLATLDHIKSRLECRTKEEYRSGNNKVLACRKCNAERDRAFHLKEKPWQNPRHKSTRYVAVKVPPELSAAFGA